MSKSQDRQSDTAGHIRENETDMIFESDSKSGKILGRYTIVSELGRGGQGVVYRALHPELPIELAIKVGHFVGNDDEERELRAEARTLCDLDHPRIARIRDFEVISIDHQRHQTMLVLDFVRGQSFYEVIRSKQCTLEQGCRWLVEVARAIDHAHKRGVLHLDLKPQNIVIGEDRQPTIIDFGLARRRSAWESNPEHDGTSGTPGFMAPEQIRGVADAIDQRCDIYALGATLYVLITGEPPIARGSINDILEKARRGEINREQLNQSEAPDPLKKICFKALSVEPDDRFSTAEEMAEVLQVAIDEAWGVVEPSPNPGNSKNWLTAMVTVALAAITAVVLFAYVQDQSDSNNAFQAPASEPEWLVATHVGKFDGEYVFEERLFDERQPIERDAMFFASTFTEPKYCFLIALNPGTTQPQLLFPADENVVQSEPVQELDVPGNDSSGQPQQFQFTDGPGPQGFLLVTSDRPLPAFHDWKAALELSEWSSAQLDGAWTYHGGQFTRHGFGRNRGSIVPRDHPTVLSELVEGLFPMNDAEVHGLFFDVKKAPRSSL